MEQAAHTGASLAPAQRQEYWTNLRTYLEMSDEPAELVQYLADHPEYPQTVMTHGGNADGIGLNALPGW